MVAASPVKVFYTYLHCSPDGIPFYVGKGFGGRSHNFTSGRNKHHTAIVNKHGRSAIGVFVFPCESEEQAFCDEQQQIAQLRSEGFRLCNYTDGGEGTSGRKMSEATRLALRNSQVGSKRSAESRAKMSASQKARPKRHPDTLIKTHAAARGRVKSPEERAKLSAALTGRKLSPEHVAKVSEAVKNRPPASAGTRAKLAEATRKSWIIRRANMKKDM